MENTNIFEYATKNKMRFQHNGSISVEDLWDLPVEALDALYKKMNKEVKAASEDSLLDKKETAADKTVLIGIEIVKHIVGVKLEAKEAALKAKERKEKNQKIMAIMSRKQDEQLENMSLEDLEKLLED
jgi:uncharacterized protein YfeS